MAELSDADYRKLTSKPVTKVFVTACTSCPKYKLNLIQYFM